MQSSTRIDQNIIARFDGVLKTILQAELAAGNEIVETYESKDSSFPMPNATMIFLKRSFITPVQTSAPSVEFREINDPHYWKAEYFDKESKQFLCCGFE